MNMPKGPLTNILVGINVAVFLLLWLGGWQQIGIVQGALIPARFDGALVGAAAVWHHAERLTGLAVGG